MSQKRLSVRWGPSLPPHKGGGAPPQFSAHFYCGQTARYIKMPLGMKVYYRSWSTRHCVRCGPSYPRKKAPYPTQFLAHVYYGQMAGWMNTPLGTEVDLGPGHMVLDGVPAPVKGHSSHPLFGPCLLWPRSPISAILLSSCVQRGKQQLC